MYQNTSALFPARIARTTYFIRWLLFCCAAFIASMMLNFSGHAPFVAKLVLAGGGASLLVFLCVALFRSILMPRLRDMGLHPAWSLLIFVHCLSFLFLLGLLFIPADAFVKRSHLAY
jgi:uncharacterized membrane protein YhaH (DUF805 family)